MSTQSEAGNVAHLGAKANTVRADALLRTAADIIGQRASQRDQANGERSMKRTVEAFNAIYGLDLTEVQGWRFMEILKIARSVGGRCHLDDFVDGAAYAALAGECAMQDP